MNITAHIETPAVVALCSAHGYHLEHILPSIKLSIAEALLGCARALAAHGETLTSLADEVALMSQFQALPNDLYAYLQAIDDEFSRPSECMTLALAILSTMQAQSRQLDQ